MRIFEKQDKVEKKLKSKSRQKDYYLQHPIEEKEVCFGEREDRILHTLNSENTKKVKLGEIESPTGDIIVSKDLEHDTTLIGFTKKTSPVTQADDYADQHFLTDHSTQVKSDAMEVEIQSKESNMLVLEGDASKKYQHFKKALQKYTPDELELTSVEAASPTSLEEHASGEEAARALAVENKINKALEKGKQLAKQIKKDDFPELMKKRLLAMEEENLEDIEDEEEE
ncbi:MAG: hypothetical protein JXO44_02475 [Clostridia bacterium]|nr:hypothetical protein [Clostridia bacterium]